MIFLVAVVAACAVIGVSLGKAEQTKSADPPAAALETAAPTAAATPTAAPGAAKDDVLFVFVSNGYPIAETSAKGADFLIKDVPALGTIYLNASKKDKRIVALSLRIPALSTSKAEGGGSAIESAIGAGAGSGDESAYRSALRSLLTATANALSGEDAIAEGDIAAWADGALAVMKKGGTAHFESGTLSCSCMQQQGGETESIVCTLALLP